MKLSLPSLVDDWRDWWRWHSVRAAAALALLSVIQSQALPYVEPLVPAKYWPWVTAAFGLAIVVLRLLQQQIDTAAKEPSP